MTRILAVALGLATMAVALPAAAGDPAAAQVLFDDAKRLSGEGKYADACVKFEESQKLDPGIGTLFNLADCFEHVGKTASAWAAFLDVAAQARAQKQPQREQVAADRAAALKPRLARLTITVSEGASASGLHVERDGTEVGPGQWGTAIPVDPGQHTIRASAPGKQTWQTVLDVKAEGDAAAVVAPLLDAASAPPAAPAPPPADSGVEAQSDTDSGGSRRVIGLVVGGAGVVGLGVSAVFGLVSKSKHDDAGKHCDSDTNHCDATGVSLRDDARQAGTISTIVFLVGATALATGAVLYFTAPKKVGGAAVTASPVVARGQGGLALQGVW
jgi:serine/threonine-protein kinase